MKAQVAIEYLVMLIIGLSIIIPSYYFYYGNTSDDLRITQAKKLVNDIASEADQAYLLGPGTRRETTISIPDGTNLVFKGRAVTAFTSTRAGKSTIFANSLTSISGSIPSNQGVYVIYLKALEDDTVEVGLKT